MLIKGEYKFISFRINILNPLWCNENNYTRDMTLVNKQYFYAYAHTQPFCEYSTMHHSIYIQTHTNIHTYSLTCKSTFIYTCKHKQVHLYRLSNFLYIAGYLNIFDIYKNPSFQWIYYRYIFGNNFAMECKKYQWPGV